MCMLFSIISSQILKESDILMYKKVYKYCKFKLLIFHKQLVLKQWHYYTKWSCSVMSSLFCNPTWTPIDLRLLHPQFPSKNTGAGCHFILPGDLPQLGIESGSQHVVGRCLPSEAHREGLLVAQGMHLNVWYIMKSSIIWYKYVLECYCSTAIHAVNLPRCSQLTLKSEQQLEQVRKWPTISENLE